MAVLIDEYDKPILDNIGKPLLAEAMRETLHGLYSVLKDCDGYLCFVFLTGISKFTKAGVFSVMNNLEDISMDARPLAISLATPRRNWRRISLAELML